MTHYACIDTITKRGHLFYIDVQWRPNWLQRLFGKRAYSITWVGCYAYRNMETGERAGLDFETWLNQLQRKHNRKLDEQLRTKQILREIGWT